MWSDLNWKSQSPCLWPKKNEGQTSGKLRFTTQNKHRGGWRSFWKPIAGGLVRSDFYCHYCHGWRNIMKKKADSPLEIQINLAHRLSNSFSKPILLSEIAHSSWQRTLRGRCNYLNLWGQRDRSEMILQSKIQNNSSFRSRKTMLTGGCRSENHSQSCHSRAINRSLKLIFIWYFPFLM